MEKCLQENGYGKDDFNDQEGVGDVSKYMLQQNPLEKARYVSYRGYHGFGVNLWMSLMLLGIIPNVYLFQSDYK